VESGTLVRSSLERRRRRRFVVNERRSGFARRREAYRSPAGRAFDGSVRFVHAHSAALVAVLALTAVLSLVDLALTVMALRSGAAEANPLMRHLFGVGSGWGWPAVAKVASSAGLSLFVWKFRRYRSVLAVALLALALYGVVVFYESFLLLAAL
jgi:hypothetical protein